MTIYPAGSRSPSLTLTQGLIQPQGVAADASGNVYVTNRGSSPDIPVYAAGQPSPYETITSNLIQVPTQIVFDGEGNLFFSDDNTLLNEVPEGSQQVQSVGLQYMTGGGGLALDVRNGNMFLSGATGSTHSVWLYPAGSVNPTRQLKGGSGADSLVFGIVGREGYLFVPDSGSNTVGLYPNVSGSQ